MTNPTHMPRLRVKLLEILTEAEKEALMHHRIQLRRRAPRKRNQYGTTKKQK